jgi:large subunit ribosomal protein L19
MNLLKKFEAKYINSLKRNQIPPFKAGDTVRVGVEVRDGAAVRVQQFEGLVMRIHRNGLNSSFLVRKISSGEGVERNFLMYSPIIQSVEVVKRGRVRRSRLYYMRNLTGKAARIKTIMEYGQKPTAA